jgi:adenosylhomocysteine nucleosidase
VVPVNEVLFEDPCVLFALRREARPFLREFPPQQRFPGAPCRTRFCGPVWLTVLVAQTGVGPERTARALDWLLGKPRLVNVPYRPKLVLSAGFAGALQPGLLVGDLVLATEVVDENGKAWPCTWPATELRGRWEPPLRRGRLLTAAKIIEAPAVKRALGQKFDALAVDMESAAVAERCSREGVPFGCLRTVSDDVDTALSPRLAALLTGGGVSPWRVATGVLRSPGLAGELWRLAKHTRFAAGQLGKALGELLTLTLPDQDGE